MLPAIPDEQFQRGEVPMTKQEIRVFLMAHAAVAPTDTVWDIGAGTGSLTVEAALHAESGRVFAIDGDAEACGLVGENSRRFGVSERVTVLAQKAPDALTGLPDPDVVFVGGSGGSLKAILTESARRLRPGGRLLVTAILVETLQETLQFTAGLAGFTVESCGLQVTRVQPLGGRHMLRSLNAVYIVIFRKGGLL